MAKAFRYVVCDVPDEPLTGSQLAVFTDAHDVPEELLQRPAKETNVSETTFVTYPEAAVTAAVARRRSHPA